MARSTLRGVAGEVTAYRRKRASSIIAAAGRSGRAGIGVAFSGTGATETEIRTARQRRLQAVGGDLVPRREEAFSDDGMHLGAAPIDRSENTRGLVNQPRANAEDAAAQSASPAAPHQDPA